MRPRALLPKNGFAGDTCIGRTGGGGAIIVRSMTDLAPLASLSTLLPKPRRISAASGVTRFTEDVQARVDCADGRVATACERMLAGWGRRGENETALTKVRVVENRANVSQEQGYRLSIAPDRVTIIGGSPAGCFYGLQTLGQLARVGGGVIPCCQIEDQPDFTTRGLLYDITRGKVPTVDTLKLLVDRIATLKCNQLHLYIEHAFVFGFDRGICDASHGMTPDEVRELDAYCHERFIDLVPALANLGHMGRILSMPAYRHLAEVAATVDWHDMSWTQRLHGLTLDVTHPDSLALVERMWTDILDAFPSPVVNICGDEPWDLGKGQSASRVPREKSGEAYLAHILRIVDFCSKRGRSSQLWGDVVVNHCELYDRLPRDLTILHWGYGDHPASPDDPDHPDHPDHPGNPRYEMTGHFIDAGLRTFVCPGTSGWKRILNALPLAERNIATFAHAGRRYGAAGLLNTDWGDLGHFNQLACSWHGISLGAACGWDSQHPVGSEFDRRFAQSIWNVSDASPVRLLRDLSATCGGAETWRLLYAPTVEVEKDLTQFPPERIEKLRATCETVRSWFDNQSSAPESIAQDFRELAVAAWFIGLLADRLTHVRSTSGEGVEAFDRHVAQAFQAYGECWIKRNKPAGLMDIAGVLGVE